MFNKNAWLIYGLSSNKFKNTYIQGFLDICGNIVLRNGGFSLSNGDVSMNGNLWVQKQSVLIGNVGIGTTTPQSILDVSGNFILRNGDFTLTNGNISLNGNIFVGQNTILNGDVSMNGNVFISQNTILNGDVSMNGNVFVRQKMILNGDVSMNGNVFISQNTIINGDVSMNGNVFVRQKTTLIGDVSMNGNVWVGLDASFNRNVSIKGITTLTDDIYQIDGNYNMNIASSIGTFPNYGSSVIGPNLINIGSSNYNSVQGGFRDSIAIGNTILTNTTPIGYGTIGIGKNIFISMTSGTQNIGIGNSIATSMTAGDNNVFIGNGVAASTTSTGNTVAIGTAAGKSNTTGINNTFIGAFTNANAGNYNNSTAIGYGTIASGTQVINFGRSSETLDISGSVNFTGNINLSTSGTIITTNYFKRYTIVGFSTSRSGTNTGTLTSGATIPFYTTGNTGYNSSIQAGGFNSGHIDGSGVFIAPVDGVYIFTATAIGVSGVAADDCRIKLFIAGGSSAGAATYAANNDIATMLTVTQISKLSAGGSCYLQVGSSATRLTYTSPKCVASGFLLQNYV